MALEPPVAVPLALQLEDEGHLAAHRIEQLGKRRDAVGGVAEPERLELRKRQRVEPPARLGQPLERIVMKDHDLFVTAELKVAFDREVVRNRGFGGRERVLDPAGGGVMVAAMGDRPGSQPREPGHRAPQTISTIASTSTAVPSGSVPTPIAERA